MRIYAVLLSLACSALAAHAAFNEVTDRQGHRKSPYREFEAAHGPAYPVPPDRQAALLGRPLQDKIKILPVPWVLSDAEYRKIQKGALQRGRALAAFFDDVMYEGGARTLAAGLMTAGEIEGVFKTDGRMRLAGLRALYARFPRRTPSFFMGPDVVRDERGRFVVLEDNVGPLGGLGDVGPTHAAMRRTLGADEDAARPITALVNRFLADIPRERRAEEALILFDKEKEEDQSVGLQDDEHLREQRELEALGIPLADYADIKDETLARIESGKIRKIVNLFDPTLRVRKWSKLERLFAALARHDIELLVSPGSEALGNKALLDRVDRMVELFLNEKPLLTSQPTEWVTGETNIDPQDLRWVYKKTDGSQGSEVYVMRFLDDKSRENFVKYLDEWNAYSKLTEGGDLPNFVRQKWLDPSFVPAETPDSWVRFNVDVRPITYIHAGGSLLPPVLWGRAALKLEGTLNNVSQGAFELVVTTPDLCERALAGYRTPVK